MSNIAIRRATSSPHDVESVASLFDEYRQFYTQPPDLGRARTYINERLTRGESTIVIAELAIADETTTVGFVQLYPMFSSISTMPVWILNDLYVAVQYRRHGAARALMLAVRDMAIEAGIRRIVLETAPSNDVARRLYESLGYRVAESTFLTYRLDLA